MGAFRRSKKIGFEMLEMDLRLTKDKIPVVFHDINLKRILGDDVPIREIDHHDLRTKCEASQNAKSILAPCLGQVLLDQDIPQWLNLEIKSDDVLYDDVERHVATVVRNTPHEKKIIFSSFNPATIWKLSKYLPEIPRAFLVSEENIEENSVWLKEFLVLPLLKIHMINMSQNLVDILDPWFLREHKVPYSVWTVNDRSKVRQHLDMGAASVITDLVDINPKKISDLK